MTPETNVILGLSPVTIANGTNVGMLAGLSTPDAMASAGNNIVIGGVGSNLIDIGGSNNKILGHDGEADFDPGTGKLTTITTLDPSVGGQDVINVTGGNNVVFGGGAAGNLITIGAGGNVVVGDNGNASFTPAGVLTFITTSDVMDAEATTSSPRPPAPATTWCSAALGADTITVGGSNNTIVGDNGSAIFDATSGLLTHITTFINELDDVNNVGGNDVIDVTGGNNVIIGGTGANADHRRRQWQHYRIGHDGEAFFADVQGQAVSQQRPRRHVAIQSLDQSEGGNNTITINGDGNNVIFGGTGANQITVNGNGSNVIDGANGEASYTNGVLTEIQTTGETAPEGAIGGEALVQSTEATTSFINGVLVPAIAYGGNNTITLGNGNNVIVGGYGRGHYHHRQRQ